MTDEQREQAEAYRAGYRAGIMDAQPMIDRYRELARDLLPFAEVGMEDTCPAGRCFLYGECRASTDVHCHVEECMGKRLRELGLM